jgi:hypothetical protein
VSGKKPWREAAGEILLSRYPETITVPLLMEELEKYGAENLPRLTTLYAWLSASEQRVEHPSVHEWRAGKALTDVTPDGKDETAGGYWRYATLGEVIELVKVSGSMITALFTLSDSGLDVVQRRAEAVQASIRQRRDGAR